jgi:uridine kinase
LKLAAEAPDNLILVLVGGCSRVGKTALVSKLSEGVASCGIKTAVINLDSWLVSLDRRKNDSSVLERYEVSSIVSAIEKIKHGAAIYPPVYDVASRRRVAGSGPDPIAINNGVLFIDGVIALAIDKLFEVAALRVFVGISDKLRRQRLVKFYSDIKGLSREEYENIIESREKEEVLFIKKTANNADVIFRLSGAKGKE